MNPAIRPLLAFFLIIAPIQGASASPKDHIILSIEGKISSVDPVDYSLAQLERFKAANIITSTPWHNKKVNFEGVLLSDLMADVGAFGEHLYVVALNNYSTQIPMEDLKKYGVILSYKKDGKYMPISEKGPLYIMYPFDSGQDLNNDAYYSRAVWQVRSITVE